MLAVLPYRIADPRKAGLDTLRAENVAVRAELAGRSARWHEGQSGRAEGAAIQQKIKSPSPNEMLSQRGILERPHIFEKAPPRHWSLQNDGSSQLLLRLRPVSPFQLSPQTLSCRSLSLSLCL